VRARDALQWLERRGTAKNRDGLARFGIVAPRAFGVSVAEIKRLGKELGRDHALALALWKSGWYEARMLAAFVDEPALVTVAQMNAWARDFDNWAICDHCCFHLFDRTPHAWGRIAQWSGRRREFEKRAAFALLASVALHDKRAPDAPFVDALPWIERAASDERNFVKKGVSWALRSVGRRRGVRTEALILARRLADAEDAAARWVGRDALRDLQRSSALAR
jgi:3-methyladenine DNA glycosylase AlkD